VDILFTFENDSNGAQTWEARREANVVFGPTDLPAGGDDNFEVLNHQAADNLDVNVTVNQTAGGHAGTQIRLRNGNWSLYPDGNPFTLEVQQGQNVVVTLRCALV